MNFLWNFIQLFFKRLNSYTYLNWKLYEFLLVIFVLYAMLQIKSHSNTNTGVHTQTWSSAGLVSMSLLVSGSWVRCRKKKCRIQKHRKNFSSRYFGLLNSSSLNMKLCREKSNPQRVWTEDSSRSTKFVDARQFFFCIFEFCIFAFCILPGYLASNSLYINIERGKKWAYTNIDTQCYRH